MIPRTVTAWAALVHDRYLAETVEFLRDNPYGLDLGDLVDKTVNEISYSAASVTSERATDAPSRVRSGRRTSI